MPLRLPLVADLPEHSYTIALDGVQYEFRLVYRDRTASWYLDVFDEDGAALMLGRRLSPSFTPNEVVPELPPGVLFVTGADPYARDEIELIYLTEAEVIASRTETVRDTVVEVTG